MDDIAISHVSNKVLKEEIEKFKAQFKTKTQNLSVTEGKVHDYVGMNLDWSDD